MKKPKRLSKKILQEDDAAYAALQAIPNYNPSNKDYTLDKVTSSDETMKADQTTEVQKHAAADAASDKAADSEWARHNMILGAKLQVKAQFGENSDEYASTGMKKKNEYKRGRRSTQNTGGTT
ncbi:MAG: hypothetical protein ABWZ66_06730 [Pyrinomonadaceae bacterium]